MAEYLDELDKLLLDRFDDAMLLSELDGFLTGVIVSPDLLPPSRWMNAIWGDSEVVDATVLEQGLDLVMTHYNAIVDSLNQAGAYEPILESDSFNDSTLWELWIEGFAAAMKLAPNGWNRIHASDDAACKAALAGIKQLTALVSRHPGSEETEPERWNREAPGLIQIWVQMLHEWRLENDQHRPKGKIGRNDPCPCGSGRKYKKCCGLN